MPEAFVCGCDAACCGWGSPTPAKVKHIAIGTPTRVVRRDCVGRSAGAIPPRCQVRERREGRLMPPQSLNNAVCNVRGCRTNEAKKSEIGKIFLRRILEVCALRETKLKGKCEVMFDEVVGRVSGVKGGLGKRWPCY